MPFIRCLELSFFFFFFAVFVVAIKKCDAFLDGAAEYIQRATAEQSAEETLYYS